ncbi:hypothetical protein GCM10010149_92660 [Nonomuraea roseoviolacea subsp. roseoviolacea]|uniref:Uncharacterized protein n=1 Tax=Nonomuraea roseoviolacea subsp. carminata TaxID=160689 RepID=A0ABT1JZ58_9ACTN|nr:hypothetical protein [Nonomuraea roseoviolacea]MCP2346627.1 hypothetical protein [Nonomuraea roseoviolacea subsp. carminata]
MIKTMTVAAAVATTLLAASPAAPAAARTKTISFGGMTLTVPGGWTPRHLTAGDDWLTVTTEKCGKNVEWCRSFTLAGAQTIKGVGDMKGYRTDRPFAPGTGEVPCRFIADLNHAERFPSAKPLVNEFRPVGTRKAQYREWAGECYSFKTGKTVKRFVQRVWYLPKEKVLVVDGWNHAELAGVLARARW